MLKGFKDFLMRGNVVDLAVAVVIGAAFSSVVSGFLNGLINPLIATVAGEPNLDDVGEFTLKRAEFSIGLFLTPLVNFVIIGATIYFIGLLGWKPGRSGPGGDPSACRWRVVRSNLLGDNQAQRC